MLTQGQTAILGIAVLVVGYLFFFTGDVPALDITPELGGDSEFTNYNIGFTWQDDNAMSGAAAAPTSPVYSIYHSGGERLSQVTSLYGKQGLSIASGTTATAYAVTPEDGDYLFLRIDTGTDMYPHVSSLIASNAGITSCKWIPTTSRNVPELACELQISKLGSPNFNNPNAITTTLLIPVLDDDVSLTLNSPSDQTSIGVTSATDIYVTWEFTALGSDEAAAFSRIWVTSNQTSTDYEVLDVIISSGGDLITMDTFTNHGDSYNIPTPWATSTTSSGVAQFWRLWPDDEDISADTSNTILFPRGSSDADSIQIRVHVQTYFTASGHGATIVLNYRLITANNVLQTAGSDSVTLSA